MTDTPALYGGTPVRDQPMGYGSQTIEQRDKDAVLDGLDGDYISRGPTVEAFEEAMADYIGVDHAVATTSGTTALQLVGAAMDFGPGDEIVTTPLTFVASTYPACHQGAKPVFADIDPETRTLDPAAVRDAITPETVALLPMHYGGHPCDIEELLAIADEHDLQVIWDCCHALGTEYEGKQIGAQRDVATFSFHPVKNITTGEGGMVVTDDDDLAAELESLRSFDMNYDVPGHEDEPWYQVSEGLGFNFNVTDFQAALGHEQLGRIEDFKHRRQEIVDRYDQAFADIPGLETPVVEDGVDPMLHLYAVEIAAEFGCSRKEFVNAMHAEDIYVQVHYVPLHYHTYFQSEYGYERGQFPNTEAVYERLVSLPLYPAMDAEDVEDVVRAVERLHDYHTDSVRGE